jgi:hypothetical protein
MFFSEALLRQMKKVKIIGRLLINKFVVTASYTLFFLRRMKPSPPRADPSSHTAAGTGTGDEPATIVLSPPSAPKPPMWAEKNSSPSA